MPAWAVREDPIRRGVLDAAVADGVFVSFDDGDHWQSLQLNLPVSQARDLTVHGRRSSRCYLRTSVVGTR